MEIKAVKRKIKEIEVEKKNVLKKTREAENDGKTVLKDFFMENPAVILSSKHGNVKGVLPKKIKLPKLNIGATSDIVRQTLEQVKEQGLDNSEIHGLVNKKLEEYAIATKGGDDIFREIQIRTSFNKKQHVPFEFEKLNSHNCYKYLDASTDYLNRAVNAEDDDDMFDVEPDDDEEEEEEEIEGKVSENLLIYNERKTERKKRQEKKKSVVSKSVPKSPVTSSVKKQSKLNLSVTKPRKPIRK